MKAVLPFLLVFGLASCEDKTYCFACQTATRVITETNGELATTMSKMIVDTCGLTEDEVRLYERMNTDTTVVSAGGSKTTTTRATGCI